MWELSFHPYTMYQTFIIFKAGGEKRKEKVRV
jgi:hypothetical protein